MQQLVSFLSLTFLLALPMLTAGRKQMCYTCTYSNRDSPECVNNPASSKMRDSRIQCPYDCITNVVFNAESGRPTFVYRGCQAANRDNGCVEIGATHNCYYSCRGRDYCNDRAMTRSPMHSSGTDAASAIFTPRSPLGLLLPAVSLGVLVMLRALMGRA